MSDQKTLETEIIRVTKRLREVDGRYKTLQAEREGWLQKPDSLGKIEKLDELTADLRIVNGDASVLRNILKDLHEEKAQKDKEERKQELERKIEGMRAIKRNMLAERNARQEVVAKARKIISEAEAEHEAVFETLFEINNQFKSLQKQFLVEKFGSSSNIPRNWQNELSDGLISEGELGWLR